MKILFFSHDGKLGDAIVYTSFVDGVLRLDPDAELHALASDASAHFWSMDRRIRKLWIYRNPSIGEAFRTSWSIRRERFDYVVTWKERFRSEKTRLLLKLAAPLRGILHEEGRIPGQTPHAIYKCAASLRLIYGDRAAALELRYRFDMDLDLQRFAAQLTNGREIILLNMFAAESCRTISTDKAAELLSGLAAIAPQALLCLSCTNATESQARKAASLSKLSCEIINTEDDLRGLISLCARADLVISPDTSLVQIASALDKPLVALYHDPAKTIEWAPRSSRYEIVLSLNPQTVNGIDTGEVLDKVQRLRG